MSTKPDDNDHGPYPESNAELPTAAWRPPTRHPDETDNYDSREWVRSDHEPRVRVSTLQSPPRGIGDLLTLYADDMEWCDDFDLYASYCHDCDRDYGVDVDVDFDHAVIHAEFNTGANTRQLHTEAAKLVDWIVEVLVSSRRYDGYVL